MAAADETVKIFLSAVSAEFREYREELALFLRRKGYEVRVQEEFETGGGTLLDKLEAYIRDECHGCIFLVGQRYGAEPPAPEAAAHLHGETARYSYTQWEYRFATRHNKARFVFVPAEETNEEPSTQNQEPEEPPELQALQKTFIREQIIDQGKDRTPFHSLADLKDHVFALKLEALVYARHHDLPLDESNPYVGLRRFEERDQPKFYGRTGLVAELMRAIEAEPLLLVTGHSGSGKSSVLRAGVIPAWRKKHGNNAQVVLMTPNDDPFEGLYEGLRAAGIEKDACAWVKDGHADVFGQLQTKNKEPGTKNTLIIVDQFEEIFTRVPEAGQAKVAQFVTALVAAHRAAHPDPTDPADAHNLRIALAMRDDFYGNLERHRTLCAILDGEAGRTQRVMRPTESELRAIIEAPAASHGVGFEGQLVERIVGEVRGKQGDERRALLPLLQFTLEALWNHECANRSIADRVLNVAGYEAIGAFSGALKQRTNRFYDALSEEQQTSVQRIFLQLVQFGETDVPRLPQRPQSRAPPERRPGPARPAHHQGKAPHFW